MYSSSLLFGLSFATAALAQIQVNGASSIAASLVPSTTAAPASAAGSSSAPVATTSAASSASSAPASQITSAASYDASSASAAAYSMMPYSSFMAGGYKSMDCGYGYSKASDGSCKSESWVCIHHQRICEQFETRDCSGRRMDAIRQLLSSTSESRSTLRRL